MPQLEKFDLILFDMIGTTVQDSYNGESLILDCFYKSFLANGFEISYNQINQQRGIVKKDAIRNILAENNLGNELAGKIYLDFITLFEGSFGYFTEIEGTTTLFDTLKGKGIKIGLGSGLPLHLMKEIIRAVGWQSNGFDYIGSSEELGKGRPDPVMIMEAMQKVQLKDKTRILKIGDTVVDIQEGKNAGVITAGVLSGTQTRAALEQCNPDYIFRTIHDLSGIL